MNPTRMSRRLVLITALVATISTSAVHTARAQPVANALNFATVPGMIAGNSPDGLGTWSVQYQRIDGGNPGVATAINEGIDADAKGQVQHYTWGASTKRSWTFHATGTAFFRPTTVSELFIGQYNTDEPNMPVDTVSTVVFDSRSGVLITWDNLFRDKFAGLTRLSEQAAAILPTVYSTPQPGDWKRGGALAPLEINFQFWIPTAQGIECTSPTTNSVGASR
jgi:hypothetical protein